MGLRVLATVLALLHMIPCHRLYPALVAQATLQPAHMVDHLPALSTHQQVHHIRQHRQVIHQPALATLPQVQATHQQVQVTPHPLLNILHPLPNIPQPLPTIPQQVQATLPLPRAIPPAPPSTPRPRLSTVQHPPSIPPVPLSTVPPLHSTHQPRLSTVPLLPLTLLLLRAILRHLPVIHPRLQATPQPLHSMTATRRRRTRRVSRRERRSKVNKYEKNPFNYCYLILCADTHFDLCNFYYSG